MNADARRGLLLPKLLSAWPAEWPGFGPRASILRADSTTHKRRKILVLRLDCFAALHTFEELGTKTQKVQQAKFEIMDHCFRVGLYI